MSAVTGQSIPRIFFQRFPETKRPGLPSAPSVTLIWRPDRKAHLVAGLAGAVSFPFFVLASIASGLPFGIAAAFAIGHLAGMSPSLRLSDRDRLCRILSSLAAFWAAICVLTVSAGFAPVSFLGEALVSLIVAGFPLINQNLSVPADGKSLTERELSCLDAYSIDESVIVTDKTGRVLGATWAARSQINNLERRCVPDVFQIADDSDRSGFSAALRRCAEDQSMQECRIRFADGPADCADFRMRAIAGGRVAITLSPVSGGKMHRLHADSIEQVQSARPSPPGPALETQNDIVARSGPTQIGEIVDFALRLMRQEAEHAGLCVELTEADPHLKVACDRRTLIQIVVNVLGNAIKFSNFAGLVTIAFRRANGSALLRITDEGIGIAEDDQERIFNAFDRSGDGSRDGHGLGLAIVHDLVKQNGGSLELTSHSGRGTIVEIHLPLHANSSGNIGVDENEQATGTAGE